MELGPLQKKWVAALRSGEYKQGTEYLCKDERYCCLGVALRVAGIEPDGCVLTLDERLLFGLRSCLGAPSGIGDSLATMNDKGVPFTKIADTIEATPEQFFVGSR